MKFNVSFELYLVLTKQPTSARSAWTLFIQASKDKFLEAAKDSKDGKFKIGVVTTELSKKWKAMSDAEKKVFCARPYQPLFFVFVCHRMYLV